MGDPGGGSGPYPRRPIPSLAKYAKSLRKFVIKAEDNTKLNEVSLVKKEMELRKIFAATFTKFNRQTDPINQVRMDRFGEHIIVTVINDEQAKLISKITTFAGHKVKVEAPYFLNTVKGIIYFPGLCHTEENELVEYFANYSVVEVQHFKRKNDQGQLVNKNLVTLTFCDSKIPSQVWISGRNVEVKPFVRNVKQCRRCLKIGHTKTKCRQTEGYVICANCQGSHKLEDCKAERTSYKCIVCPMDSDNNHSTRDKLCPTMIYEKEICSIMANRYLSYPEAKATIAKPKQTYSSIIKAGLNKTKPTNTIAVQTICSTPEHVCKCLMPMSNPSPTDHIITPTKYKTIKTTNTAIQAEIHNNPSTPTVHEIHNAFRIDSPIGPLWSPISPRRPETQFVENLFQINNIEEGENMIDDYTERLVDLSQQNGLETSNEFINNNNKRVTSQDHKEGGESHRPKNDV